MKLKRYELWILCITALVLAFTGGYFLGRNTIRATVTTETTTLVETQPPQSQPETAQDSEPQQGALNLNTATAEQLQTLEGIGPTLAERIVDYRKASGGFQTKQQLMEVSGIGEKIYAEIEDDITVE